MKINKLITALSISATLLTLNTFASESGHVKGGDSGHGTFIDRAPKDPTTPADHNGKPAKEIVNHERPKNNGSKIPNLPN